MDYKIIIVVLIVLAMCQFSTEELHGYGHQMEIPTHFNSNYSDWSGTVINNNIKYTDGAHDIFYKDGLVYALSYRADTLIIYKDLEPIYISTNVCDRTLLPFDTIKNKIRKMRGGYISKAHDIVVTSNNYYIACDNMHSIVDKDGLVYANDSFNIYALDEKDGYITFATKSDNGVGLIKDGRLLWYHYCQNCFNAKFYNDKIITSNESVIHISELGVIEAKRSGLYLNNKLIASETARELDTADVDNDGDIDILTACSDLNAIFLYNNTNNNFIRQTIDKGEHLYWVHDVKFIDDKIYVASSGSNAFIYYEVS